MATFRQICCAIVLALACCGCVSRRMTIRTEPPEALVEVDGQQLGLSPVSLDFTYYGTREITISKPGYETVKIQQPVSRPISQRVPIDFATNHFLGAHVTDRHDYVYQLREKVTPIDEEADLIQAGQNFRAQSQIRTGP